MAKRPSVVVLPNGFDISSAVSSGFFFLPARGLSHSDPDCVRLMDVLAWFYFPARPAAGHTWILSLSLPLRETIRKLFPGVSQNGDGRIRRTSVGTKLAKIFIFSSQMHVVLFSSQMHVESGRTSQAAARLCPIVPLEGSTAYTRAYALRRGVVAHAVSREKHRCCNRHVDVLFVG